VCCFALVKRKERGEEPGREQLVFSLDIFIKKKILINFALPGAEILTLLIYRGASKATFLPGICVQREAFPVVIFS
jgi:hypothetical protein